MALFSKDGTEFIELPEDYSEDDLVKMKAAGYSPYQAFTNNGEEYIALPAEINNVKKMQEAGYETASQWQNIQRVKKESKVKPGAGESFVMGALDELSLGAGKYARAGVEALTGGSSFGQELEVQEYLQKRREEEQPLATGLGKLTGAIGTGIATGGASGIVRAAAPATSLAGRIGMGAAGEALPEAIKGVLESKEKDIGSRLLEGGVRGAIGVATGGLGGALTKPAEAAAKVAEIARPATEAAAALTRQLTYAGKEGAKTSPAFWIFPPAYKAVVVAKTLKGLKETRDDYKVYKGIVNGFRDELGDVAKKFDDDTIFSLAISQEGVNPAKEYFANLIAKTQEKANPDDILKYLVDNPELSAQARRVNVVSQGKQLTEDFSKAYNDLYTSVKQNYDEALKRAKPQFEKQGTEVQEAMADLFGQLKQSKASSKYTDELQRAYHSLTGFKTADLAGDISSPETQRVAKELWESLPADEQFDRLTEARSYLEDIYKGKGALSTDDRKIYGIKKLVSDTQKKASAKAEADVNYKGFFDLKNRLDDLGLTPDDLTQSRVRQMIKGTEKGTELTNELSALKEEIMIGGLKPEQQQLIVDQIDHILKAQDFLGKEKELVSAIKSLRGLTKEDMSRIAATAGSKSTLAKLSGDVSGYGKLVGQLEELAQSKHQKSYNELSKLEQLRLLGQLTKGQKKK